MKDVINVNEHMFINNWSMNLISEGMNIIKSTMNIIK